VALVFSPRRSLESKLGKSIFGQTNITNDPLRHVGANQTSALKVYVVPPSEWMQ